MGRENFHRILNETQQDVLRMGSLVEEAINRAVDALARSDVKKPSDLPDPFQAACPNCGKEATYPRSSIGILAAVGHP